MREDECAIGDVSSPHRSLKAIMEMGAHQSSPQSKEDMASIEAQEVTAEEGFASGAADVGPSNILSDWPIDEETIVDLIPSQQSEKVNRRLDNSLCPVSFVHHSMWFVCVQPSSSIADGDDVLALFDDIAAFIDADPAEVQDSLDSPTTHFSVEEV